MINLESESSSGEWTAACWWKEMDESLLRRSGVLFRQEGEVETNLPALVEISQLRQVEVLIIFFRRTRKVRVKSERDGDQEGESKSRRGREK